MALADVKIYFKQVEDQWFEARENLTDFEQALKEGYITEDRLACVKEDFAIIDDNYQRLAFIMHLFAIPNRHSKKLTQSDKMLIEKLSLAHADSTYVIKENEDALARLRADIKKLEQQQ